MRIKLKDMCLVPNTVENLKLYYPAIAEGLEIMAPEQILIFIKENQWLDINFKEDVPSGFSTEYLNKKYPGWESKIYTGEEK